MSVAVVPCDTWFHSRISTSRFLRQRARTKIDASVISVFKIVKRPIHNRTHDVNARRGMSHPECGVQKGGIVAYNMYRFSVDAKSIEVLSEHVDWETPSDSGDVH